MDQGDLTTAASWDRIWDGYEGAVGPSVVRRRMKKQREWERLLARLLDSTGQGDSILEIGCAPGVMLTLLHDLRPDRKYRGIDYAPRGAQIARRSLDASGIEAEIMVADMRTAEVAAADLVMSFGLIEHFDDPSDALACHRRLTRIGGFAAVTVPNYAHPVVRRLLRRYSPQTLETHNLSIMSDQALSESMKQAGFVDIETGLAGVASLPSSRVRGGMAGRAYAGFARAWNLGTEIIPAGWPWSNHVWGIGRNPQV